MIVNIQELPIEIKSKLPITLQLLTTPIELTKLPIEVQYLLTKNKIKKNTINPYNPKNVYETDFVFSIYNDFKIFKYRKDSLIFYLQNYFLTPKGSYPFDPEFGNELKKHLQTKDTSLRNLYLQNELKNIVSVINESFRASVKVNSYRCVPFMVGDHTEYYLEIICSIENDQITFTVQ
jgi:hypothetical protein